MIKSGVSELFSKLTGLDSTEATNLESEVLRKNIKHGDGLNYVIFFKKKISCVFL